MWSPELSQGNETAKARHRVVSLVRGLGLDIGCGNEKVVKSAIGIDIAGTAADIRLDLGANDSLAIFADGIFDYVYSSHCLEDFASPDAMLREWWRVLAPGGHLILYGPDPEFYPKCGTPGANPNHKIDLYWEDVWKIVKGFGNASLVSSSRHNETNEYSWLLVARKKHALLAKPLDVFEGAVRWGKKVMLGGSVAGCKRCLVIRYGALGDAIWMTPVVKQLKRDGYHVTYNCSSYSAQVLRGNPNIDEFLIQDRDAIPNDDLSNYWSTIGDGYDLVLNLSGSVEGALLKREGTEEFDWKHDKRHAICNVNYQDRTMELSGYPKMKGEIPELHFTELEHQAAREWRRRFADRFVILWSLSGSAFHKIYPWTEQVATEICRKHSDVVIGTVGDEMCKILEWQNPQTMNASGVFSVRQSMILTQYADLVIGAETGILNAAACYDTPKIIFLSHSSVENLPKHWMNCTSLFAKSCDCYPCHRLIYTNCCPKGPKAGAPKCMENILPETVYQAFLKYYRRWKDEQRNPERLRTV